MLNNILTSAFLPFSFLKKYRSTSQKLFTSPRFRVLSYTIGMRPAVDVPGEDRLQASGDCLSDLQSVVNKDSAYFFQPWKGINGSARVTKHSLLIIVRDSKVFEEAVNFDVFPVTVHPLSNEEQRRGLE